MIWTRWGLLTVLALLLALGLCAHLLQTPCRPDVLRACAAGADRVVIKPASMVAGTKYAQPAVEIAGADQVNELLGLIDFELPEGNACFHCMCDGDYHIDFYRGDALIMSLGYHHNNSLRWRQGPWDTDVTLTEQTKQAVPAWFVKHGYASMQAYYAVGPFER